MVLDRKRSVTAIDPALIAMGLAEAFRPAIDAVATIHVDEH
jgi:hypothetical protein